MFCKIVELGRNAPERKRASALTTFLKIMPRIHNCRRMLSGLLLTLFAKTISNYSIVAGYCHPSLVCPQKLPIAYLEIPRVACTSNKKLLANIDGIDWKGHGTTQLPCCSSEPLDRVKYVVVRHPYDKLLSVYNHATFCTKEREKYCRHPLTEQNKHDFFSWVLEMMKRFPTDDDDKSNHFKSQVSHFHDKRLTKPHDIESFTIVYLENLSADWALLNKRLCKEYKYCNNALPPLMKSNFLSTTNVGHNMSLIYENQIVKNLIDRRIKMDFERLGYKSH